MDIRRQRVLIHLRDGRRVPVESDEVFLLESDGDETIVRMRGRRTLRDVRSLSEVLERFSASLMVQIHRSYAVNVDRVTEIRRRPEERDWELKLEPPVNRILPISRSRLPALWAAYGET
jgi:DNA-binding LytR/AlgR family response regulator